MNSHNDYLKNSAEKMRELFPEPEKIEFEISGGAAYFSLKDKIESCITNYFVFSPEDEEPVYSLLIQSKNKHRSAELKLREISFDDASCSEQITDFINDNYEEFIVYNTTALVDSVDEVLDNIETFNAEIGEYEGLQNRLSQFKHWYYSKKLKLFGPSKFVGYKSICNKKTNAGNYLRAAGVYVMIQGKKHYKAIDGRRTEPRLREALNLTCLPSQKELEDQLADFLNTYGKEPKKGATITIVD